MKNFNNVTENIKNIKSNSISEENKYKFILYPAYVVLFIWIIITAVWLAFSIPGKATDIVLPTLVLGIGIIIISSIFIYHITSISNKKQKKVKTTEKTKK